jgi:hypothetical protein
MPKGREHGDGGGPDLDAIMRTARDLPRRLRQGLDERPGVILIAVAGTSFVAGTVFGSRLGRSVVLALLPVGLQYLLGSKLGSALYTRIAGAVQEAEGGERTRPAGGVS